MALEQRLPREIAIHRTWILDTRPEDVIPDDEFEFILHTEQEEDQAVEERCFSALLPLAKKMVADYKNQIGCLESSTILTCSGREPHISCALCPGKKALRGWEAFILHLKNFWKNRVPQHRALFRALKEALKAEVESLRQEVDIKAWPPVLIVNNSEESLLDGKLLRRSGEDHVPQKLTELKLHEVLAVYSKGGSAAESRVVVAYPASDVGFVDAKQLEMRCKNFGLVADPEQQQQLQLREKEDDSQEELDDAVAMTRSFCGLVKREISSLAASVESDDAAADAHGSPYGPDGAGDGDNGDDAGAGDEGLSNLFPLLSERQQCEFLREKWSKSFEASKQVKLAVKPPRKPSKTGGVKDKFQRDLRDLDHLNVDGKLKMRFQIEEMEKQLNKERLNWLRSIDLESNAQEYVLVISTTPQKKWKLCRTNGKVARSVKAAKGRRLVSKDDEEDDERELSETQNKVLEERLQSEKRRRFLIAKYQQEQVSLKKQADLAKRERAHLINIFQSSNF